MLVVIDHATKQVEAKACNDQTAETAAHFVFEDIICCHDAPKDIWSDRGKCFTGEVMAHITKLCGIVFLHFVLTRRMFLTDDVYTFALPFTQAGE